MRRDSQHVTHALRDAYYMLSILYPVLPNVYRVLRRVPRMSRDFAAGAEIKQPSRRKEARLEPGRFWLLPLLNLAGGRAF